MKEIKSLLIVGIFLLYGCNNHIIQVQYIKEGKIQTERIPRNDFMVNQSSLRNHYIDSMSIGLLDSISFENNKPDNTVTHCSPIKLNSFRQVKVFSPEYYEVGTAYYTSHCIDYYIKLFHGKLNFNSQREYKSIKVILGDIPLLTSPNEFIFEKQSFLSPSIFYHEVGHRAFWLLDDLGIKFHGNTYVSIGLLEYFTTSLNDSPIIGEAILPSKLIRNASLLYKYPLPDSMYLKYLFSVIKSSFQNELQDSSKNISRYYNLCMKTYGPRQNEIIDNHRGALVVTSTLWRIREKLGQKKTDRLVAETILDLNNYMSQHANFYISDKNEKIEDKISWYDLYYGLLKKDKELFKGIHSDLIKLEFKRTGFPVEKVKNI